MMHSGVRKALLGASVATLAMALSTQAFAQQRRFDIPAQDAASAVTAFGLQADLQISAPTGQLRGVKTPAVQGEMDARAALQILLAGTGLVVAQDDGRTIVLQMAPQSGSAAGGGAEAHSVEALIVTAQKKEEDIQDVPIAISAFTQKSLDAQKIEGGFDLLKAIPNVTFSKNNFTGYNFSIRGIGTKAISATTDPGVAVSMNNTTLIVNRLFEQEYFDVERVEVLRGPQGTLYGRNATSGVINVHTTRPRLGEFEGDIKLETGNYNARRVRGMVNVPIGDTLALRVAGAMTQRDGYGINEAASDPLAEQQVEEDVDNRDLWSARMTIGWEPIEAIRANLLWERFEEDDRRVRTSKQLCHTDLGQTQIGEFNWDEAPQTNRYTFMRPLLSQTCKAGSLYEAGAYGTPYGPSLPFVFAPLFAADLGGGVGGNPYFASPYNPTPLTPNCAAETERNFIFPVNICERDPYRGRTQTQDLRSIYSLLEPTYRAKADIFELSIDIDLTDSLTFTSQTVYSDDEVYATQDFNRFRSDPVFADTDIACGMYFEKYVDCRPDAPPVFNGMYEDFLPGGVFTDPQLGPSKTLMGQDLSKAQSEQFNQEFRLASNFDSNLNFSLGSNFTRFETQNDYYVFINMLSLLTELFPFNTGERGTTWCWDGTIKAAKEANPQWTATSPCVYVDPNPLHSINGEGHNYFRSANPYELTSAALFGELYWQATETLKVTLGARMTWDQKIFTPIPSQLLLSDYRRIVPPGAGPEACNNLEQCKTAGTGLDLGEGARGSLPNPDIVQEWREPTGRLIVDWKPDLGFTDETMIYGSIAHGYKGGGANPPNIAQPAARFNAANSGVVAPPTFEPEFIDAFEVGTKNTLMGGALILNGAAFFYDYKGYQVSKIVDRSASNENFDAKIWGAELEWIFSPTRNLRFNGTLGHLGTEIARGERSIDLMNRTLGGHQSSYIDADGVEHDLAYDEWLVLKPWITNTSNCVIPAKVVEMLALDANIHNGLSRINELNGLCPGGGVLSAGFLPTSPGIPLPDGTTYNPARDGPNGGAGFFTELGGNELPNAPHWTASMGAQYRMALPAGWDATFRVDHYWQDESYARVYNTEYDRLRSWQNTNFSLWVENPDWGVTAEVYVKNAFDEEPITDAFLNSDDSGLTTNVFTLDPRLVGVSVRKQF